MSNIMIKNVILENCQGEIFKYNFFKGVTYFKGGNGCGKTEFLNFIDYLLGSSTIKLSGKWYDDFVKGTLVIQKNGLLYKFSRTHENKGCFFQINDAPEEKCSLEQYIIYLSMVSTEENSSNLQELRNITNIDLSLRACSPFMFIEETGITTNTKINFLTKCREYKYQKWASVILDYIFHPNSSLIYSKRQEIEKLKIELKKQQELIEKLQLYKANVNESLKCLNSEIELKKDVDVVKNEFIRIRNFENFISIPNIENVYQLNEVTERLKIINNTKNDVDYFEKKALKRKEMLIRLNELTEKNEDFSSYTTPIITMINEMSSTISFSKLLLQNKNSESLEKIKKKLKNVVKQKENNQTVIELDEKIRAISIGEKSLSLYEKEYKDINIEETESSLRRAEDELDELIHEIDENKIEGFKNNVIALYKSAINESPLVKSDIELGNFYLDYDERNNAIVPSVIQFDDKESYRLQVIHRGSQARSSIIQLCGYCALQIMLQKNKTVPCFPLLIMDHFSKPFSSENIKAIGCILAKFYELLDDKSFQVVMFDIKEPEELNLEIDSLQPLIDEEKSGFIPWINEKK